MRYITSFSKKMRVIVRFLVLFSLLMSATVFADTLVLEPAKDNTLYEDPAGRFSNGAGQYLFMGRTGSQNGIPPSARRALLSFDLSVIPVGSQVTSAALQISINKVPPQAGGAIASIHRVEADWGEGASNAPGPEGQGWSAEPGDATWVHRFFDTNSWATVGGDFNATASQTTNVSSTPEVISFTTNAGMIADVQYWIDQPAVNYGWVILGDENAAENARRMASRESASVADRPQLTIEYIPAIAPPAPPAVPIPTNNWPGLLLLISVVLFMARRRAMPHRPA